MSPAAGAMICGLDADNWGHCYSENPKNAAASSTALRSDTTELELNNLKVIGDFHFSVSAYDQAKLRDAKHPTDLIPNDYLSLYIDGSHMGVGGDDSWSPSMKQPYRLDQKHYRWTVYLSSR